MSELSLAGRAPWLRDATLQRVLAVLSLDGEEARVVGGAVRNAFMDRPVTDIDIATTTVPAETARRGEAAGFKAIDTGADHGTITLIAHGVPYEVTTLRADIETDGRRAKVAFGRDWTADAERRDFTINAIYAGADGVVFDPFDGVRDAEKHCIRFIGNPLLRIEEDVLRILRFFRLFAWYGSGRPDAAGLKACARLKSRIPGLSAERVWSELKKLLSAPDPARALLWMRQTGVLTAVLPETEKWGIDAVPGLIEAEREAGWPADPLLRLMSIVPPRSELTDLLADRLRLSKIDRVRLMRWSEAAVADPGISRENLAKTLYKGNEFAVADRYRLLAASKGLRKTRFLLDQITVWSRPTLPVRADDLISSGLLPGPRLGQVLRDLEDQWVESDFQLDRAALLQTVDGLSTSSS